MDNLMHGKGKLTEDNGTVYEGEWERGKKSGFGKTFFPDGPVMEGYWVPKKRRRRKQLSSEEREFECRNKSWYGLVTWPNGS